VSAVSTPSTPPTATTLQGLANWCMLIFGQNTSSVQTALYAYLNQAQKDWEMEFPDHTALQKSQQLPLTAPIATIGQDTCYHFTDSAPDFRKEKLIRIVSPLNYSGTISFMDYVSFRTMVPEIVLPTTGIPQVWYWAPEDPSGFHVWPLPSQAITVQFDYVAYAPELLAANDSPFMDREFHKALGFQALFYLYNSDPVNTPDKGAQWSALFEGEKRRYKKDQQRRQAQMTMLGYGTGVNEGDRNRPVVYFK
jgi:hypothetical protein